MNIIFLDIDGVLNRHIFDPLSKSSSLDKVCIAEFNRILDCIPDAKIVLSSAWRYMIHGGAMTIRGFEYMLRTHGVHCVERILDLTVSDEEISSRCEQINFWLAAHPQVVSYVILDDLKLDMPRQVVTNGQKGLTTEQADQAIDILHILI